MPRVRKRIHSKKTRRLNRLSGILFLMVLVWIGWVVLFQPARGPSAPGDGPAPGTNSTATLKTDDSFSGTKFRITLGTLRPDIISNLGNPRFREDNSLEYEGNILWFTNNGVCGWYAKTPRFPVYLNPSKPVTNNASAYTIGSSRDEVLHIQGTPTRFQSVETPNEFAYGPDHVTFKDEKVHAWRNSNGKLKVELLPEVSGLTNQYFSWGSTRDEVLNAQGTPEKYDSESDTNTLRYGLANVYFKDNRVHGWYDLRRQLKIREKDRASGSYSANVLPGMDRQQILLELGIPEVASESTFRYAGDEIHFQSNKVVGWNITKTRSIPVKLTDTIPTNATNTFTHGASLNAVLAAQGAPDIYGPSADPDLLVFSKSRVFMKNGAVRGWEDPDGRLKLTALGITNNFAGTNFTLQSPWQQVVSVQGIPRVLLSSEMRYDQSSVYLDQGRVIGWKSDTPKLKVTWKTASTNTAKAKEGIYLGDTLEEVVSAIGVPSVYSSASMDSTMFFDGNRADFREGRLVGWVRINSVLKIRKPALKDENPPEKWGLDSSREQVLWLQGIPDEATMEKFRYDTSAVYFNQGKVSSWFEGSQALKTGSK